ncbi:efflux RND transporter periplasmic adaptor subunit [Altererythrobacter sp.]|uniref:efflux RND transporter periplasmic adaptor subunit n=1 Tax=Altererythrobacter sp. TaxID=1872480 RepID=UPI001B293844|nr:efflux RND transporter periplasmic adaptor subunit [Altererythrobacter sp.]MBO6610154.1 efflux RND transporter periplasmic adaptor subunit [Altererythrobacter sp.]MBO6642775.1 efflux RND transporter periplasmic adaptor subunit [Altererythrobacter sp.]MBO6708717.1 efflux RND transporter periplasmic adaptor subunit [Altererythrobacter sp.]MBO6945171.1 efflux RND transporter periplasmic adaptor subunit [Altererythrobacter sp.]
MVFGRRFIGLVALTASVSACSSGPEEEPEIVRPAKLFQVEAANERIDVSFPAIIEARNSSTLTFQVGGLLQDFLVEEGQPVRRGQVIARLDPRRYQNAVNSAQAQFDNAQSEYESAATLFEQNAISGIAVQQREAQRDVAAATLDSAKKDLADTMLRAPFSGVIAEKLAIRFENVGAQQDIVKLQSTGSAEAVVSIPASLVPRFANARPTNAYVVLSSAPDINIPGRFLSARTQADTQSQTFRVKFAFNPPANMAVLPGMTGTVFVGRDLLQDEVEGEGISIPLGSILSDGRTRYVWLVDKETMTVSKRIIQTGSSIGEEVNVIDGLAPGDTIVSAGASFLHDGMTIRQYED